jgi:hypothetical protein
MKKTSFTYYLGLGSNAIAKGNKIGNINNNNTTSMSAPETT